MRRTPIPLALVSATAGLLLGGCADEGSQVTESNLDAPAEGFDDEADDATGGY